MRIPRIYTPQELSVDQEIELEAGASHHLVKVLRMESGRPVRLFNGDGHEYQAVLTQAGKKAAKVQISEAAFTPNTSPLKTELAIGLSKGDRFDWVLQKATELGVSRIVPLFTQRSEIRLNAERLEKKHASWQQICIGACEQSGRNFLPELKPAMPLDDYLDHCESTLKLVLHHRSPTALGSLSAPDNLSLLIGPEGGLSDEEISKAESNGFQSVCFGRRVLRTETAPITALSICQYLWGDLAS